MARATVAACLLGVLLAVGAGFPAPAVGETVLPGIYGYVNDAKTGTVLAPLRAVAEWCRFEIVSVDLKSSITCRDTHGTTVRFLMRQKRVEIVADGSARGITTDVLPCVLDGVTLVPLRAICEAFGITVTYSKDFHDTGEPAVQLDSDGRSGVMFIQALPPSDVAAIFAAKARNEESAYDDHFVSLTRDPYKGYIRVPVISDAYVEGMGWVWVDGFTVWRKTGAHTWEEVFGGSALDADEYRALLRKGIPRDVLAHYGFSADE